MDEMKTTCWLLILLIYIGGSSQKTSRMIYGGCCVAVKSKEIYISVVLSIKGETMSIYISLKLMVLVQQPINFEERKWKRDISK